MKRWAQRRPAQLLAGIVLAGLAATWAVGEVLDQQEMTTQDRHEVARMTHKMKTICIGRFLVDMPEETRVSLANARIDGFNVSAFKETSEAFHKRLVEREAQVIGKPDRLGGNSNLESERRVHSGTGLMGKIFVHSRNVLEGTAAKGLDTEYFRYENVALEGLVHADGISIDLFADEYDPGQTDNLARLISQLVPNADNPIPSEPGFCIDHAYFRDPLTPVQNETITMFADLPSHPDVAFMVILAAGRKPEKHGLIERKAASRSRMPLSERMHFRKLRAAPREIGGVPGEEVVESVTEVNDAAVHTFWWEVDGTESNVFIPHVVFKMTTGNSSDGPVPSSLSDAAGLALWDAITSSIRIRPGEDKTDAQPKPAPTALGANASAGERCPQSGWWLCRDAGAGIAVLGGRQQYIDAGRTMPQALLLPRQTLWDRIRGLQPSFESTTRTSWTLADRRLRERQSVPCLPAASAAPAGAESLRSNGDMPGEHEAAVGTQACTGYPCPASGWWRCEQPDALDGPRWFARGSTLPPATFAAASSVFHRPGDDAESTQRHETWRLLRIAGAPQQGEPG